MVNWKNIFKNWTGVPVLILVVLAVVWVFTNGLPGYKTWQYKRAYEKMAEPYKNDTYGGKTPEETYNLFIDALKDGDVELASKYFVIEEQERWNKSLQTFKNSNTMDGLILDLENTKKIWRKSDKSSEEMVSFVYPNLVEKDEVVNFENQELVIPAGNYKNVSVFVRYPNGIWKIEGI